jgi:hypothetical protein
MDSDELLSKFGTNKKKTASPSKSTSVVGHQQYVDSYRDDGNSDFDDNASYDSTYAASTTVISVAPFMPSQTIRRSSKERRRSRHSSTASASDSVSMLTMTTTIPGTAGSEREHHYGCYDDDDEDQMSNSTAFGAGGAVDDFSMFVSPPLEPLAPEGQSLSRSSTSRSGRQVGDVGDKKSSSSGRGKSQSGSHSSHRRRRKDKKHSTVVDDKLQTTDEYMATAHRRCSTGAASLSLIRDDVKEGADSSHPSRHSARQSVHGDDDKSFQTAVHVRTSNIHDLGSPEGCDNDINTSSGTLMDLDMAFQSSRTARERLSANKKVLSVGDKKVLSVGVFTSGKKLRPLASPSTSTASVNSNVNNDIAAAATAAACAASLPSTVGGGLSTGSAASCDALSPLALASPGPTTPAAYSAIVPAPVGKGAVFILFDTVGDASSIISDFELGNASVVSGLQVSKYFGIESKLQYYETYHQLQQQQYLLLDPINENKAKPASMKTSRGSRYGKRHPQKDEGDIDCDEENQGTSLDELVHKPNEDNPLIQSILLLEELGGLTPRSCSYVPSRGLTSMSASGSGIYTHTGTLSGEGYEGYNDHDATARFTTSASAATRSCSGYGSAHADHPHSGHAADVHNASGSEKYGLGSSHYGYGKGRMHDPTSDSTTTNADQHRPLQGHEHEHEHHHHHHKNNSSKRHQKEKPLLAEIEAEDRRRRVIADITPAVRNHSGKVKPRGAAKKQQRGESGSDGKLAKVVQKLTRKGSQKGIEGGKRSTEESYKWDDDQIEVDLDDDDDGGDDDEESSREGGGGGGGGGRSRGERGGEQSVGGGGGGGQSVVSFGSYDSARDYDSGEDDAKYISSVQASEQVVTMTRFMCGRTHYWFELKCHLCRLTSTYLPRNINTAVLLYCCTAVLLYCCVAIVILHL